MHPTEQIIGGPAVEAAAGGNVNLVWTASQSGTVHLGRTVLQAVKYDAGGPNYQVADDPYSGERFPFGVAQVTIKGDTFIKSIAGQGMAGVVWASFRGVQNRIRLPSVYLAAGETVTISLIVPAGSPRLQVVGGAPFSPEGGDCDMSNLLPGHGAAVDGYALGAQSLALASGQTANLVFQPIIDGIADLSRLTIQGGAAATPPDGTPLQLAQQEPDISELLIITSIQEKNRNQLIKGNNAVIPNMFAATSDYLWCNLGQQVLATTNTIVVTVLNPLSNAVDLFGAMPFLPEKGGKYSPSPCK